MTENKYPLIVQMTVDDIANALIESDIIDTDALKLIKKLDKAFEDSDFTKTIYYWAVKQQKKHDKEITKGIKDGDFWSNEEDLWVKPKKAKKIKE